MSANKTGIGIVGAGVVSAQYLTTVTEAADLEVRFIADLDPERARARAEEFGVAGSGGYEQLLTDPSIEVVVNLTVPQVHAEVTRQALKAGRHVWSEKPLALDGSEAGELMALAAANNVRLACAPDTFLGFGLQRALRLVRDGEIGTPRSALGCFQYGGPNLWHPNPEFLFRSGGGPLLDMGPYYLTALVQVFGAICRVSAQAVMGSATRTIFKGPRAGETFAVEVPTHVMALYEFVGGGVANVILSFDTPIRRTALEVAGTRGSLRLPDPNQFTGDSEVFALDGTSRIVPAADTGGPGRGTGVVDLVRAARAGLAERAAGTLACHVLDALRATQEAADTGLAVDLATRVEPAPLLPDGWTIGN